MALFLGPPGELVPQKNFWTLRCKGRLTEADTLTIQLDATPSGLTSATSSIPLYFCRPDAFLPPNQQCHSTEGIPRNNALKLLLLLLSSTDIPHKQSVEIPQHVAYWCRDVATSTRQHWRLNNGGEQITTKCLLLFSIVNLLQQCLQCCPTQT